MRTGSPRVCRRRTDDSRIAASARGPETLRCHMSSQWPRIKSVWRFHTIIRTRHSPINSKNASRARIISTMTARVTTRLRTVVTRAASPQKIALASASSQSRSVKIPHTPQCTPGERKIRPRALSGDYSVIIQQVTRTYC